MSELPETRDDPLDRRMEQIIAGLQEGIRREVAWRRRLGLPIHVIGPDGRVIDVGGRPPAAEPAGEPPAA